MLNQISLFLLTHKKEQANRWVSQKDTCLRRDTCSFWYMKRNKQEMSITDKSAEADFFLWHFRGNINFLPPKLAYVRKKEIFGVLRTPPD